MDMLGPRAKKRVAKFQALANALVDSWPSWEARKQNDYSTAHPTHYLNVTIGKPPPKPPTPRRAMPPELLSLLKLQQKNGQWKPSAAVFHALGDYIPDPKGGMADWRWVTALCCAFIRRYPEFWPEMEETYNNGLKWVPDQALLNLAGECLPPPLDYAINPAAVAAGDWKHEVSRMTNTVGYTAFEPDDTSIREAFSRTEEKFRRKPTSPSSPSIMKPADAGEEDDEHDLPPLPDDVPSWRKEQLLRDREEEQRKKREAKIRRQEKKERNDLLRMLKRGEETATERERSFIKVHKSGLQTEWDAVADTGERPFVVGEVVSVYARRRDRWSPISVSQTPHPAAITRANLDGSLDVVYLDGGKEREYRVARKYICRKGECGYEVGVGGWKLMRTRAEALREHWADDLSPDIATETQRLVEVSEAYLQKVPFTAKTTVKDVILPLRSTGQLDARPPSSKTRRFGSALRASSAAAQAGSAILSATLSELSDISSRGTRTVGEQVSVESSLSSAFSGSSLDAKTYSTSASRKTSAKLLQQPPPSIDAQICAAEGEVVAAIMAVEANLRIVKPAVLEGSRVFGLSISVEAKQTAFSPLTQALRAQREVVIHLCDAVDKWQTLKVAKAKAIIDHAKRTAVLPSLSGTATATPKEQDPCDSDGNIDVSKISTEPPPFVWNGDNVLVKVSRVLDYLGQFPELVEWYSDTYVFACNPLCMHCGLADRPATPVSTTRRMLVGGEEIDQEVEALVQQNAEQTAALKKWGLALNDSPPWWPIADVIGHDSTRDDDATEAKRKKLADCRRASKILLAELGREQERRDKFENIQAQLQATRRRVKL